MSIKRHKWLFILTAVVTLLIAGRLYRLHVRKQWLKPVVVERHDGLIEITLPVTSKSCDSHGGCAIETDGLYQSRPTGITINVAPGIHPSTFTDRMETTKIFPKNAGITLLVDGPRGQSLVSLLAASYDIPTHRVNLPTTVVTTAISFDGDPADIQNRPLKFKIVHLGGKEPAKDFELFISTDLANNKVELSEKDIDYRPGIVKTFGAE